MSESVIQYASEINGALNETANIFGTKPVNNKTLSVLKIEMNSIKANSLNTMLYDVLHGAVAAQSGGLVLTVLWTGDDVPRVYFGCAVTDNVSFLQMFS